MLLLGALAMIAGTIVILEVDDRRSRNRDRRERQLAAVKNRLRYGNRGRTDF